MVPSRFSFIFVLGFQLSAVWASKALELLTEEENELTQRRLDFAAWCEKEVATQEKQRQELIKLQGSFNAEDSEDESFDVPSLLSTAKQLQLMQQGKVAESPSHSNLDVAVQCLAELESELVARSSSWAFGGEKQSLQAVRKVLGDAREQKAMSLSQQPNLTGVLPPAQLEMLKARQLQAAEAQALHRAKSLAARSGRQVLDAAVVQTNAALSDAAGICGLGRTVMNRTESAGKKLVKQALELIGKAEGAAEALTSSQAVQATSATVKPHGTDATASSDEGHAQVTSSQLAHLLEVSQELQQQQQQMQQQMAELRQLQAEASHHIATDVQMPPAAVSAVKTKPQEPVLPVPEAKSSGQATVSTAPAQLAAKTSMSLAAEVAQESKLEAESEEKAPELPAPAHGRARTKHHALEPQHHEVHEAQASEDEDLPKMQAPKDFPAALRGGWQGLLAKKRAESKKKPSKPDDALGIMELMQTPKTYTAWQPDQGVAATAVKAKDDLLAAEKALDDDDEGEKEIPAKKDVRAFHPDRASMTDPLAFFQFGSEIRRPALSAPKEDNLVAMLLRKFALATNSTLLMELSQDELSKESLQSLLHKLETESPDAVDAQDSELRKMCEAYEQESSKSMEEELSNEVHNHYTAAKAREEKKVLQRELQAREHLLSAFGRTSHRLMTAKQLIQSGAASDKQRFQQLNQEVQKLGQSPSHTELQILMSSFDNLVQQEEQELTDAVVTAVSRQEQAESRDQHELEDLKAKMLKLDSYAQTPALGLQALVEHLKPVWHILVPYNLLSVLFTLAVQLYGPFLRSMVECAEQVKPGAKFSGSTHCGNSHYVLSVAQAQEGRLVAMKLLVHAFAGPLLALLADSMGRRPILLLGLTGFLTAFLLFALVAFLPSLHGSSSAISLCFFLEGATSAFDVVFLSMLADTAKSPAARVTSFSLYYATGAFGNAIAIGMFVEEMSWEVKDFGFTWASMSLAMAMLILYVLAYVPETLPSAMLLKSKHSKLKAPHVQLMGQAIEQIQFLASSRFLQIWLLAVLLKSSASGLSSINASFTLAVYGWKPGEWQAWIWPSEIISMSSLGILGPWAGRKKAEAVISVTALVSVAAHVLQMLAPFHALALLGPHFIAGILAFVRPVSAAYLSGRFPASQQAKVQAIAHLSHNCGISLSMAIFSSPQLFRPQARGWDAARPFLFAGILSTIGNLTKMFLVQQAQRTGWMAVQQELEMAMPERTQSPRSSEAREV
ncbi:kif19 [Symbiodinium sp. CCMP2456]|nr:kif19 [Symbiodinium sp. CCMP2456]